MLATAYAVEVEALGRKVFFDEDTIQRISKVVDWMLNSPKRWLLLYGGLGTGKSTMLRAILRVINLFHKSSGSTISTLYNEQPILLSALHLVNTKYEPEAINERGYDFNTVKRRKIVFLDELGIEPIVVKNYGTDEMPMWDFFEAKYDDKESILIMTANLDTDKLEARYQDRIADRFEEKCRWIAFEQEISYRRM